MKSKKTFFGFFFGIILIVIPIVNVLHFILIDHDNAIHKKNDIKKHRCDNYIFYPTFIDTHDQPNIQTHEYNNYQKNDIQNLIFNEKKLTLNYHFTRGPPKTNKRATYYYKKPYE